MDPSYFCKGPALPHLFLGNVFTCKKKKIHFAYKNKILKKNVFEGSSLFVVLWPCCTLRVDINDGLKDVAISWTNERITLGQLHLLMMKVDFKKSLDIFIILGYSWSS